MLTFWWKILRIKNEKPLFGLAWSLVRTERWSELSLDRTGQIISYKVLALKKSKLRSSASPAIIIKI